jgi:signal transduction histidine kinase
VARRTQQLQASRDLLQSVLDTSLISMSVLRAVRDEAGQVQDFRLALVNKELERETGRTDLVGKLYAQEYPGVRQVGIFDLMLRALATNEPQTLEYFCDHEGFHQWYTCQFVKMGDGVVATNLNITERKLAEQERLKNLRLLEQAVAGLGSWDYELATGRMRWSDGMYHLVSLPLGQPVSPEVYLRFVVSDDRPRAEQLVRRLTSGQSVEETLRLQVGEHLKTVRLKAVMLRDEAGQPARVLGVDFDISELQRLEADNLRMRLGQQQALFEAVQAAQEEERRRMSESLHNGIGQILYATKLQLDRLPNAPESSPRHEAARLLGEAIRQTRALSHELSPAILEEFGLEATLRSICRTLSMPDLQWHCHFDFEASPPLAMPLQLVLYRLAQELAQNVLKHAQATEATLEVEILPGWAVLRVEDNGRGFDLATSSDGLGLRTLRSRVALLRGTLRLTSTPGQGT